LDGCPTPDSHIRPTPFRRGPILVLAAAAALPMLPVLAIEVPIRDLLMRVVGTLL